MLKGRSRLRSMCMAAVLVGAFGLTTATTSPAASAKGVVAVIKAQDEILNHAAATRQLRHYDLRTFPPPKVARRALPVLRRFVDNLRTDVRAVANASTDSFRQRQGQLDYVHGVRIQIRGFVEIEHALAQLIDRNISAGAHTFERGQKLLESGNVIANRGDSLLGLSTRY
jgi:hypothetical protein